MICPTCGWPVDDCVYQMLCMYDASRSASIPVPTATEEDKQP